MERSSNHVFFIHYGVSVYMVFDDRDRDIISYRCVCGIRHRTMTIVRQHIAALDKEQLQDHQAASMMIGA